MRFILLLFIFLIPMVSFAQNNDNLIKQRMDSIESGETKPTDIKLPDFNYVGRFDVILYTNSIGKVHGIAIEDKYKVPYEIKLKLDKFFKTMQFTKMKNMRIVLTITKLNN